MVKNTIRYKFKTSLIISVSLASSILLSACNINSSATNNGFNPPLNSEFSIDNSEVVLLMPDYDEKEKLQLLITHLTQLMNKQATTHEQKAQILYQIGIVYDRLGLDVMARTMFLSSLTELPDFASAYNFLGIYLASAERFAEAYEAFDAALELDENETYAHFNRGIALYYGNRAKKAIDDLEKFYNFDKNDPFRIAWLYIAERTVHGEELAKNKMQERINNINQDVVWGLEVLDYMLGKIDGEALINSIKNKNLNPTEKAQRLCEAYFYMAKIASFKQQHKKAYDYLHLCLHTNITGYLEYRYAILEITRYERENKVLIEQEQAYKAYIQREKMLKEQAKNAMEFFKQVKNK